MERLPFTPGARSVAVPLVGGPARPAWTSPVPPEFTFKGMPIVRTNARGQVERTARGRPRRRKVLGLGMKQHLTSGGIVQWKGAHRTFILMQSRNAPRGGVLQRVGPEPGDIRMVYSFARGTRLEARLPGQVPNPSRERATPTARRARLAGTRGGPARAKKLSRSRRRAIARKAARIRSSQNR